MPNMIPAGYDPSNPSAASAAPGSAPPGSDASAAGQGSPAPDQGSVAQPSDGSGNTPDPAASTPASAQGQAQDGADAGGPRAVGSQKDADDAAVANDPSAPVQATAAEQAQYHQLVSRFLLFISDQRQATPQHLSPMDSVLQMLNNAKLPLPMTIGQTTANIVFTMVHAAAVQKVQYDPEVLFHAADELVVAIYLLGNAHGIFKGVPPFHGLASDGTYDFQDAEIRIIGESKMQAVRYFGNLELKNGLITPEIRQANQAFWTQQIQREVHAGNVSDDVMQKLQSDGVFDKVHAALGTDGSAGSVASQAANAPNPMNPPDDANAPPPSDASATVDATDPNAAPASAAPAAPAAAPPAPGAS